MGFLYLQTNYKGEVNSFFAKNDCKERLLDVFLYFEIPIAKAETLAEEYCIQKDLSNIITYYRKNSE